jgi:hypothetical protein
MTGMEWAVCNNPNLMVNALRHRGGVSDRKWRLFVATFWRIYADKLNESRIELIDESNAMEVWAETGRLPAGLRPSLWPNIIFFGLNAAETASLTASFPFHTRPADHSERDALQAGLLRDLFGNPFRPPTLDLRWRTSDVLGIVRGIYEDRAFERMPILADALMDAGCEQEAIIGHCRCDSRHVRGCWVLDALLGKE